MKKGKMMKNKLKLSAIIAGLGMLVINGTAQTLDIASAQRKESPQIVDGQLPTKYVTYGLKGNENHFSLALDRIIIRFAEGVPFGEKAHILSSMKGVPTLKSEYLLAELDVTVIPVHGMDSAELKKLLDELNGHPSIVFANSFLVHENGTYHAMLDEVIVRLKSLGDRQALNDICEKFRAQSIEQNKFDPMVFKFRITKRSKGNALEVANAIHLSGKFAFSEPDFLVFAETSSTNDPLLENQWALNNTGSPAHHNGVPGADMNVFDAWGTTHGSADIKVAVLDLGVDLQHPDLQGNLLPGFNILYPGNNPGASGPHGTMTSGVIAAVGNNNLGLAGVAYGSKVIPVKIAAQGWPGTFTRYTYIADGINWAWQNGADVISQSVTGLGYSSLVLNAVQNATTHGRGGLGSPVLFAAGNNDRQIGFPADQPEVIAVGAMSMCFERKSPSSCDGDSVSDFLGGPTAWGSNFGPGLDVVAPGVKLTTTIPSNTGSGYTDRFTGTSAATANAAGVMALILSANPLQSFSQARQILEGTCRKVGGYTYSTGVEGQPAGSWNNEMGYGLIDAHQAVMSVPPMVQNDAGVSSVVSPMGTACSESVSPSVNLVNFGSDTLYSVNIHFQVDNGAVNTYQWVGSLATGSITTVDLPSTGVSIGEHQLSVYTSVPNGVVDEYLANDTVRSTFTASNFEVTLTLNLTSYPERTSWLIRDGLLNTIENGDEYEYSHPYGGQSVETYCLAEGCYDLIMRDGWNSLSSYVGGSYTLTGANGDVLASAETIGLHEIVHFCSPGFRADIQYQQNVSCNGAADGIARVVASGGAEPYSYAWSNGATGQTAGGLTPGTHIITVTDSNGDQRRANVRITQPAPLVVSAHASEISCIGAANGRSWRQVSGGTQDYRYSWSNGGTGWEISGLDTGRYVLTVTDANGCSATDTAVVSNACATCSLVGIDTTDFESGFGIWEDGGEDCDRIQQSAYANSGSYSIRLRDDNGPLSSTTSQSLDLSLFSSVVIGFSYYAQAMEPLDRFWLEVSIDGGANFTRIESWTNAREFENRERHDVRFTYTDTLSASTRFRFRCDASTSDDKVYLDDITISGCRFPLPDPTCTDGIFNGDETGVDCGGSCLPCTSCTYGIINSNDFESEWGIWNDGGSDCRLNSSERYAHSGSSSIWLRDNDGEASSTTTNTLDLSGYKELAISFSAYARSFDAANEDLFLEISRDGGQTFDVIQRWAYEVDFVNEEWFFEEVVFAGTLTDQVQLRFRCDATTAGDRIYIDDVVVQGCEGIAEQPGCDDGIRNGYETGVDCGGECGPCGAPEGCDMELIHFQGFEDDWGPVWTDGGRMCKRYRRADYATNGEYAVEIKDDRGFDSSTLTEGMDLSGYDQLIINFGYYARSMETGESFALHFYESGVDTTVATYISGVDFENEEFKNASVTISGPFDGLVNLQFECIASNAGDRIHLDDIAIYGCSNGGPSARLTEPEPEAENTDTDNASVPSLTEGTTPIDLQLYPNPNDGNFNLRISNKAQAADYRLEVINALGQIVQQRAGNLAQGQTELNLSLENSQKGLCFVRLIVEEEMVVKKMVVE